MKPEFISLTAAALHQALDLMGCLYSEAGATPHRERARRATAELMANPELGGVWLIAVDAETAGYLCVTVCYSLEFAGHFALLDELYLKEAWRGKGIGRQAIVFAEEWSRARGLAAIRLEVAHANLRAIELYRRQGFKAHERHLMTKWL
jgi:ribosomal protein S18 acetylase RimI-like enzyme